MTHVSEINNLQEAINYADSHSFSSVQDFQEFLDIINGFSPRD
jgi:hypothetical protein